MDTANLSDHLTSSRISPRLPDECQSETSVPRPRPGRKRSSVSMTERDDSDLESTYRGQFSTSTSGRKIAAALPAMRFTLLKKEDSNGTSSDPARSSESVSPHHSMLDISDDDVSKLGSSVYGEYSSSLLETERFYSARHHHLQSGQQGKELVEVGYVPNEKLFQHRDPHTVSTDTSSVTYQSPSFVRMPSSRVEDFKADTTEEVIEFQLASEEGSATPDAALQIVPINISSEMSSFDLQQASDDDGLETDNQEEWLFSEFNVAEEIPWSSNPPAKPSRKILISLLTASLVALVVGAIVAIKVIS
eukprot:Protomagalhaensia_wolfi_Nauph_80__1062@NODE_1619_length_1439_cov_136_610000_g602_i1_p1_GENE_NODE_1619_length_1439_cov_136_610000_g602_i1NODE_1619_length_1439_cov_136_610000_g602_i1_p1_ORF_typecomplete_len305_score34_74_NODE_1619_length_1439_cov_136_610000_g602_i13341248